MVDTQVRCPPGMNGARVTQLAPAAAARSAAARPEPQPEAAALAAPLPPRRWQRPARAPRPRTDAHVLGPTAPRCTLPLPAPSSQRPRACARPAPVRAAQAAKEQLKEQLRNDPSFKSELRSRVKEAIMSKIGATRTAEYNFDSYMLADVEPGQLRLLDVDERLVLPTNSLIRVLVTSSDVIHSWAVPALGVKIDAVPGRLNQVRRRAAPRAGSCRRPLQLQLRPARARHCAPRPCAAPTRAAPCPPLADLADHPAPRRLLRPVLGALRRQPRLHAHRHRGRDPSPVPDRLPQEVDGVRQSEGLGLGPALQARPRPGCCRGCCRPGQARPGLPGRAVSHGPPAAAAAVQPLAGWLCGAALAAERWEALPARAAAAVLPCGVAAAPVQLLVATTQGCMEHL
jgi:hypothetical protein